MKLTQKQATTRSAQRVLLSFTQAMKTLLSKNAFEKITVNELCDTADYPRSTFYNYFEDKYDLLAYCWSLIVDNIGLNEVKNMDENQILIECFDRLYRLINQNNAYLQTVLKHNSDGFLKGSLHEYMVTIAHDIFTDSFVDEHIIPVDLLIEHCFSTIMIVLDWIFVKHNSVTLKVAHQYLAILYGIQDFKVD